MFTVLILKEVRQSVFKKERNCDYGIFVIKPFQEIPEPEKIREYEKLKYIIKRHQKKLLP